MPANIYDSYSTLNEIETNNWFWMLLYCVNLELELGWIRKLCKITFKKLGQIFHTFV